jgi:competence protein ComEC
VLIWGVGRWLTPRELSPVEQLIEESRTLPGKVVRAGFRAVWVAFAVSLILGAVNSPLVLARQNVVSPVGVILGPPLVFLTSVALIAGFLLLLVAPLGTWPAWPFAFVTRWSLAACEWLVRLAEDVPGAWVYAPGPTTWWLVGFYVGVAGVVLFDGRWRLWFLAGLAAWVLGGLALPTERRDADELRVTFLAVGNGGCVVMETPDGRVLFYDAGTISGPDVTRRVIAPYLWSRGIRRIDEVFVSHADLDHYNGLAALMDRFPVGQVTLTPSFREKPTPGVGETLAAIDRHRVRLRIAKAGDRFEAGDVAIEVLHPPELGPAGNENARSMVLLVRHAGHTILLTGDLEGAGQSAVRHRELPPVDVMLAPHHGAVSANAPGRDKDDRPTPGVMAAWARPRFVVSSQGREPGGHLSESYGAAGGVVWDTATSGAITVRSHPTGLIAESYRAGEVRVIRRGG